MNQIGKATNKKPVYIIGLLVTIIGLIASILTIIAYFSPSTQAIIQQETVKEVYKEPVTNDLELRHIDFDVVVDDVQAGLLVAVGSFVDIAATFVNKANIDLTNCILRYQYRYSNESDRYYNDTRAIAYSSSRDIKNFDNFDFHSQYYYEGRMKDEDFYFSISANKEDELRFYSSGIFSDISAARVRITCSERMSNWYYLESDRISYSDNDLSFERGGFAYEASRAVLAIMSLFE